ncbi:RICIN domain-containing protein [Crossiella sp. SN42]|uniref:RICIN domain-containing protein n=1 Tax=Crossiella sp. SN42 TaxID=2944808 RepID=UPI00207C81D0|nr:RICIN domain-containing protein [Crossiella sp. SN42]MCO1576030.1 RICIN domain-containing protein [Crossiella sp. SN42]
MRSSRTVLALAVTGLLAMAGLAPAQAAAERLFLISTNGAEPGKGGCLTPLWGSKESGAYLGYEVCDNSKSQSWRVIEHGGGWYGYQSAGSGLCATVFNAGTGVGEDLVQQPCTGVPHQRWRTVQHDPVAVTLEWRAQHSDKCLSVAGTRVAPADVLQLDCSNQGWQRWALVNWPVPPPGGVG